MSELADKVKSMMSDYRYAHTLSVVNECKNLAGLFGIDDRKLVSAAYLHDITKEKSIQEQIAMCRNAGKNIPQEELSSPKTLHAYSAFIVIPDIFPEYSDDEILCAVRYHTTGRKNMSLTEKILYLADYIEPTRKFDDCIELRKYFYSNTEELYKRLDETILRSLKITLCELLNKDSYIHSKTIDAYNYLVIEKEKTL